MNIKEKRKEITALINNIKEHSDRLKDLETLPLLELSVILSKINKLHENTLILKYLSAVKQKHEEDEFGVDTSFIKANLESVETEVKEENWLEELVNEVVEEEVEIKEEEHLPEEVQLHEEVQAEEHVIEESHPDEEEDVVEEQAAIEEPTAIEESVVFEEQLEESVEVDQEDTDDEETSLYQENLEAEQEERPLVQQEVEESLEIETGISLEELEQNEELESKPDLNEVFSEEEDGSLSGQLKKQPIADILSSIGLNERYSYANELFDGDVEDFKRVIGLLNDFDSAGEAIEFFNNELSSTYNWETDNAIVQALLQLVERRHLN